MLYEVITPSPGSPGPDPGWDVLLEAAGLSAAGLTPVEPEHVPPVFADRRAAWRGVYPDSPETEIRVEAAAFEGRPVYFESYNFV